ncbi:hypothetical protein GCM10022243_03380 [Saccharothrix violaceirubra]
MLRRESEEAWWSVSREMGAFDAPAGGGRPVRSDESMPTRATHGDDARRRDLAEVVDVVGLVGERLRSPNGHSPQRDRMRGMAPQTLA